MFNSASSHTISQPSLINTPPNKWWVLEGLAVTLIGGTKQMCSLTCVQDVRRFTQLSSNRTNYHRLGKILNSLPRKCNMQNN